MKQLGNLAIVCAKRADVSLHISEGQVFVRCDTISPQPWSAPWNDDNAILAMIRKLNFGDSTNERNTAPCESFGGSCILPVKKLWILRAYPRPHWSV